MDHDADSATLTEKQSQPWNEEPPTLSGWRLYVVGFSLLIGFFLAILDTTIIATSIYSIAVEFGALSTTFWVVLAYTLGYVSFVTVFARISDFTGRHAALIAAFILFVAASLGCGWSTSLNALIACRALQGIGGAGLFSLALTILLQVTPPKKKGFISGVIGATIATSGAIGPLLGGELTQHATWRWTFWINGPCGLIGLSLFLLSWPTSFNSTRTRRPFREFDWIGTILLMAASVLVVFGLQRPAEGTVAWSSAETISTLTVGGFCWIALFAYEYIVRKRSLAHAFPYSFLRNGALSAALVTALMNGFAGATANYTIPIRFQLVNGQTPSEAGIKLLPFLCSSAVGAFVGGNANSRRNNLPYTIMAASVFITLGVGLMATLSHSLSIEDKQYGFQVLIGLGVGLTSSSISLMTNLEAQPADRAVGQGISGQGRILGSSIGIAAANGLNARQFSSALVGKLPLEIIKAVQTNSGIISTLKPSEQALVRAVYADGFTEMAKLSAYVGLIGFVFAVLTWRRNRPQPLAVRAAPKEKDLQPESEGAETIHTKESASDAPFHSNV